MGASVVAIVDAPKRRRASEEAEQPLPELHFAVIPTGSVDLWWDVAEKAIAGVHAEMTSSWDSDAMRQAIKDQRAWLCITFHVKHPVAVTVICRDGDQFAQTVDWLVWIAWSDPANVRNGIARHVRHFTDGAIEAAARAFGARRLKAHSPRGGMQRMVAELGWRLLSYTFVKDL